MTLNEKALNEVREEFNHFYRQCKNHISTTERHGCPATIFHIIRNDLDFFYGYITALSDLKLISYSDYGKFLYSARTIAQETKEECEKYISC